MNERLTDPQATVIQALPEPSLLITGDGTICATNAPFRRMLGLSTDALIAQRLGDVVTDPPEKLALYLQNCARSRQPVLGTLTFALSPNNPLTLNDPLNDTLTLRCEGSVVEPWTVAAPALILLRLRPREAIVDRFVVLNRTIDELNQEVRERRQVEARLRLLAEVSTTLAAPLEYRTILQQIAEVVTRHYADWCMIYLVESGKESDEESGGESTGESKEKITRVATAHVNAAKLELARKLRQHAPHYAIPAPFVEVIKTGQSLFVPHYDEAVVLVGVTDVEQIAIIRAINPRSVIAVPLQSHGQTLGTIALVWSESERYYLQADLAFVEELARRVAPLVENARLFEEARAAERQLRELNVTLEQRVQLRTEQVRQLVTQLTMSEQEERRRISSILHDDLQQRLYGLDFQLTLLRKMLEREEQEDARQLIAEVNEALRETVQVTRRLSVDLSPPILHTEGLYEAIRWLATQMEHQQGLAVAVKLSGTRQPLHEDIRVLVFQIVRELLFNIVKHAGVATALVMLEYEASQLRLQVRDEGKGFDPNCQTVPTSQGLPRIRQRLELIGGGIRVDTSPGAGTSVSLTIPLSQVVSANLTKPIN